MARFKADEVDNYGNSGGSTQFFKLANDGDVAVGRFMYSGIDDIDGMTVHKVKLGDKERYVNCLREYNDPLDKCPFCAAGLETTVKVFVPFYDEDTQAVKLWERGKKFFNKLSKLCSRYPNLVSHVFEIERNGKAGDTGTTYEIYPADGDFEELDIEDLPEVPKILGGFVMDKTAEDMEAYLDTGNFPRVNDDGDSPRRRDSGSKNRSAGHTQERRSKTSRRDEDEGFMNIPNGIDDEIPFGNDDEEERPARRGNAQARRTPSNNRTTRRRSNDDEF